MLSSGRPEAKYMFVFKYADYYICKFENEIFPLYMYLYSVDVF